MPGMPDAAFVGCDATFDLFVAYEAGVCLCTDDRAQAAADGCPKSAWEFLERVSPKNIKIDGWTHRFSDKDLVRAGWQSLFGDVAGSIQSTTKISFNLDGITDPVAAARAGKPVDPCGFEKLRNWELHKVVANHFT
ncbi:hypothetical protein ACWDE0_25620 [Streptomyces sp. 900105755]